MSLGDIREALMLVGPHVVLELPKNSDGKVLKAELRALLKSA